MRGRVYPCASSKLGLRGLIGDYEALAIGCAHDDADCRSGLGRPRRTPRPHRAGARNDRVTPSDCRAEAQRNSSPLFGLWDRLFWILLSWWRLCLPKTLYPKILMMQPAQGSGPPRYCRPFGGGGKRARPCATISECGWSCSTKGKPSGRGAGPPRRTRPGDRDIHDELSRLVAPRGRSATASVARWDDRGFPSFRMRRVYAGPNEPSRSRTRWRGASFQGNASVT